MTSRLWLRGAVAAVALGTLTSAACSTSINHVLADPSRYRDHEVRVSGSVQDSFSIAERGAYRIADQTGQLWVVSDNGVPRVGAQVTVVGTIREGFNLGVFGNRIPRELGGGIVLVESSHRAKY